MLRSSVFGVLLVVSAARCWGAEDDPPRPARPPRPLADDDHGRPVEKIAAELGVTPEKFREVFRRVRPAARGEAPTREQREENRRILAEGLGVSPERLDEVMDKYRPTGPNRRGDDAGAPGRGPDQRGPDQRGPGGRGSESGSQRTPDGGPGSREQRADRAGGPGRPGAPPPHNSERFVEHALEFDADGDGKLDRDELMKFAHEMGHRRDEHEQAARGPRGAGPPPGRDD